MKTDSHPIAPAPSVNPKLIDLQEKLITGVISAKEFKDAVRTEFGEEIYDMTYTSWRGAKRRAKKLVTADGVTLSPNFVEFHDFVAHMGMRLSPQLTLDRVNGALGYTEKNCRWADKESQTHNRDITAYAIDRNGQSETLAQWAKITGTPLKTLSKRRSSGWSDPDIIHGRTPQTIQTNSSRRSASTPTYGRYAREDSSPSGDNWPPKTKNQWDSALNSCHSWPREDKVFALNFVETRRVNYSVQASILAEGMYDPNDDNANPYLPTADDLKLLAWTTERAEYFQEWHALAKRTMFPKNFIHPKDIW